MTESSPARRLQEFIAGTVVVIGIGNTMRGDDGAGPRLVELLQPLCREGLTAIDAGPAPERHFGEAEALRPDAIVLVDAVDFGGASGAVAFFEEESLPERDSSTHDVPLRLVMRYLRTVTGARVGLVGIQPATIAFGAPLSPEVEHAVQVIAQVLAAAADRDGAPVSSRDQL